MFAIDPDSGGAFCVCGSSGTSATLLTTPSANGASRPHYLWTPWSDRETTQLFATRYEEMSLLLRKSGFCREMGVGDVDDDAEDGRRVLRGRRLDTMLG